jgi:hypothetical protein
VTDWQHVLLFWNDGDTKVIVSMDISVAHPNSVQPTAQHIQLIAVSCSPHTIAVNTTVNHSSHFKVL